MTTPKPETIQAWTALQTTSRLLLEQVEAALHKAKFPPLPWYDALLEIEKAGKDGIRPFLLKDRLLLPQYGTSRLLDRISADGLIERLECDEDGRGFVVRITTKGRQLRRKMWRVYSLTLIGMFEGQLTINELDQVTELMRKTRPV